MIDQLPTFPEGCAYYLKARLRVTLWLDAAPENTHWEIEELPENPMKIRDESHWSQTEIPKRVVGNMVQTDQRRES